METIFPPPALCFPMHTCLREFTQTHSDMYLCNTSAVLLLPFRSHASECFCLVLQAVHQSSAVLGLGLIGMAEDLGSAMAHRALEHLLQYGDTAVRSVVITVSASAAAHCSAKVHNFWMKNKLCPNVTAISMRIVAGREEAVFCVGCTYLYTCLVHRGMLHQDAFIEGYKCNKVVQPGGWCVVLLSMKFQA